ncbi:MAG: hypothetical protein CMK59_02575 [Proteobacteria bacterium]|nr:hypothetical protein [Pseudomonadota bacterium]
MLFLFMACSSVMIHEVPEKRNRAGQALFLEEEQELLPVKGPDVKVYNIKARYSKMPKQVYSGGHNINMRSEATILSDVVAKIPLGHPITILESAKESTIGDRQDIWYHVESKVEGKMVQGYLFGTTLTPHLIQADLDMDGVEEQLLAVYNNNYEVLLRLYDPNGAAKTLWSNMGKYEQDQHTAEKLVIRLYPKEIIGRPMLRLDVTCPKECSGKSWTKFVSYYEGKLLRALEYESQETGNSFQAVELDFNALSRNLILSRVDGQQLSDGILEQVRITEMWKLYGGVFRLQSSAPPLTEHLPPPSVLMDDDSWLVTEPVTEFQEVDEQQELPIVQDKVEAESSEVSEDLKNRLNEQEISEESLFEQPVKEQLVKEQPVKEEDLEQKSPNSDLKVEDKVLPQSQDREEDRNVENAPIQQDVE